MAFSSPIDKTNPARIMQERIEGCLAESILRLLQEAAKTGNWEDTRGTSDSLLAMSICLPETAFVGFRSTAAQWLTDHAIEVNNLRNWGEEVWDTSVALIALASLKGKHSHEIIEAQRWLLEMHKTGHDNWNDEPWETLWALLALHAIAQTKGWHQTPVELRHAYVSSLTWLLDLADHSTEKLINWHYTGLLLLVANRMLSMDTNVLEPPLKDKLQLVRDRMSSFLIADLSNEESDVELWTKECWSNSLVLWALAENENFRDDHPRLPILVQWYESQLRRPELPTEDLAFASIALFYLAVCLETTRDKGIINIIEKLRATPQSSEYMWAKPYVDEKEQRAGEALKLRLGERLSRETHDFMPKPNAFSASIHDGYYTLNLPSMIVNVSLIALATVLFTLLAHSAEMFTGRTRLILTTFFVVLGALCMVAQLFNFSLRDLFGKSRKN